MSCQKKVLINNHENTHKNIFIQEWKNSQNIGTYRMMKLQKTFLLQLRQYHKQRKFIMCYNVKISLQKELKKSGLKLENYLNTKILILFL